MELRKNLVRVIIGNRVYDSRVKDLAQMNELKELASSKLGERLVVQ
jgi:hypothetical protein